ncbi:hypothetical protein LJR225_004582 [Phenylobacterium sp. LjRoot225]|uniref:hypothetical protein n=1 Tax=Phenylobacterium sp. LjRoot225 TaxID=3342285 RepID=UPI003ECF81AC
MQVLLGLSSQGQVQLTELLTPLRPIQMLKLARNRWAHFASIEVWDDAVCVLRLPPTAAEADRASKSYTEAAPTAAGR